MNDSYRKLTSELLGGLGSVFGVGGELLIVLDGGSLVPGLLGGGGDGEHHVGGVLHVGVDLEILLVGGDGVLALAQLGVGAGDELVGVGALHIGVGLLEGGDGVGALAGLHEGHAFLEEQGGKKLLGLVFLPVGGGGFEGGGGTGVVTGLHQGLAQEKLALSVFRSDGDHFLEGGGGTGEVLGLQKGSALAGEGVGNQFLGFGGNLFDTVSLRDGGSLLEGSDGLVILGLVDLLLGNGEDGLRDDLLALGDHVGSLIFRARLELGEGALELGQGLGLVGLEGLGSHVEGFHSGVVVLGGSNSCGESKGREGDK